MLSWPLREIERLARRRSGYWLHRLIWHRMRGRTEAAERARLAAIRWEQWADRLRAMRLGSERSEG